MTYKPIGWRKQPARHALASRGIRTGRVGERDFEIIRTLDPRKVNLTPDYDMPHDVVLLLDQLDQIGEWNNFEPHNVRNVLAQNRDLWSDVLPSVMRDEDDVIDTLFIIPKQPSDPDSPNMSARFTVMGMAMDADEIHWVKLKDGRRALRVWWD